MLSDQPQLSRIISTALLCHWGQQSLEDMTPLGTDFEMYAIWQEYIKEPAAKDFIGRKARTIALSKVQGSCHRTSDNQPYSWVWKFLGDSLPKLYCVAWQGLCQARKWSSGFFVSKKGMICGCPMDVCTRNLWQKAERGKINGSESSTRFSVSVLLRETHAFCARNMGLHIQHTTLECQRYKKKGQKVRFHCSQGRHEEISE